MKAVLDERTAAVIAARSDAAGWGRLGMAYQANGLLVQAATCYTEAARLDPREPRWLYRLALLRARRSDLDGALRDLDRVIQLAPAYAPARWRRGQWLLDRGDTGGAEAAFRSVLQTAPQDPAASAGLAQVFLARNDNTAAGPRSRRCSPPRPAIATRCSCSGRLTGVSAATTRRGLR